MDGTQKWSWKVESRTTANAQVICQRGRLESREGDGNRQKGGGGGGDAPGCVCQCDLYVDEA